MKAIVYTGLGALKLDDVNPTEPGPGEALVRVRASGLCHTDLDVLHGRYGRSAFPLIPGHEYAGEVVAVGPEVTRFAEGDRVVVDPNISCGVCRPCRRGLANLCESLGAYGVTVDGGFAEYGVVRETNLVPAGELPFEVAALAEPMGCVLNGVDSVGVGGVERALVFGAGPIGILMSLALRARGVDDIRVVDVDDSRLGLVSSFGLAPIPAESTELAALEREMDLTVDATGIPGVVASLTRYTANGGKVLYFGVCGPDVRVEISPFEVFRRQLTIAGSHSLNHNIEAALEAIRATAGDIGRVVSHRLPIEDLPAVMAENRPTGALKIQAIW